MTHLTLQKCVCVNLKDSSLEYKTVCWIVDARLRNMTIPNLSPLKLICSDVVVC